MKALGQLAGLFAILMTAGSASAQSSVFSENFESGAGAWTLDPAVGGISWGVDGTPVGAGAILYICGPPIFSNNPSVFAGVAALNWNNGVSIDYGGTLTAGNSALGPLISLTSVAGVTMTFEDWYECDSCAIPNDHQRFVDFLDAGGAVMKSIQLSYSDGPDAESSCAPFPFVGGASGNQTDQHTHTVSLATLSSPVFRIRFRVVTVGYTGAGLEGENSGWFVDNINVICPVADGIAPPVPTALAPLTGAVVVSPVVFDWTDSIDTGPCGPGTVTYVVEIDNIAGIPTPDFTLTPAVSTVTQALGPGSYTWRVRARDSALNFSAFSATEAFTVEVNTPPLPPDTLHVNLSALGAQTGNIGTVDPLLDELPVFSAIFRDTNTFDNATQFRMQIALDAAFATIVFDSGLVGFTPFVPKDTRCPDLSLASALQRDTVYFWHILMVDGGAIPSLFSAAQSFRIGDDFEFGVRPGSSNHSRRCWVATAAWGSADAPTVEALQIWRGNVSDSSSAGLVASRAYHVAGPVLALAVTNPAARPITRAGTSGAAPALAILPLFALAIMAVGLARSMRRA